MNFIKVTTTEEMEHLINLDSVSHISLYSDGKARIHFNTPSTYDTLLIDKKSTERIIMFTESNHII